MARIDPRTAKILLRWLANVHASLPEEFRRICRLAAPNVPGQPPNLKAAKALYEKTYGRPVNARFIKARRARLLDEAVRAGRRTVAISIEDELAAFLDEGGGGRGRGALPDPEKEYITQAAYRERVELREQGYRDRTGGATAKAAEKYAGPAMKTETIIDRLAHIRPRKRKPKPRPKA
jgi:hypothetical protein